MKANELFETSLALLESLNFPTFILALDDDGQFVITECNQLAQNFFSYDAQDILGRQLTELSPNAQGLYFHQKLLESHTEKRTIKFEFSVHREHYSKQFQIDVQPLQNRRTAAYLATAIDITESRATLTESTQIEHMVSEMESYMANAANDLQSPLEHLSSLSKKLKSNFKDLGDGKLQLLDQVEKLSKSTLTMVSGVLDHSRAINSTASSTPRFELKQLCSEVLDILDPHHRHTLLMDSTFVFADPRLMRVAIATLLANTIKNEQDQSISLSISAKPNNAQTHVEVTVYGRPLENTDPASMELSFLSNPLTTSVDLTELHDLITQHGGSFATLKQSTGSGQASQFSLVGSLI